MLLFAAVCAVWAYDGELETVEQKDCTVYVLLDKKETADGELWTMNAAGGFEVADLFKSNIRDAVTTETLALSVRGGALCINGKRLSVRQVKITPTSAEGTCAQGICTQGNCYDGAFYILYQDGVWHLVNGIDLEEYVGCVLRAESWPGWPLEVNKVLAIVFRTYVVAKLLKARGKRKVGRGFLYDVLSTNAHQTYKGKHDRPVLRQAVEETRGVVLAHNNQPIEAMYDACCGGLVPAHIKGIDFQGAPYLARTYPCTFCSDCKLYSWKATYTAQEVVDALKPLNDKVRSISSMRVSQKDKAGVVHEVTVKAGKTKVNVSGKKTYSLFKDIKSYCFSVAQTSGTFVFEGRGYGHHLGLCQWGAREMIRRGQGYTEVLSFYYPSTRLMKLEVASANV